MAGGAHPREPDRLSNIIATVNDLFGDITSEDDDRVRRMITEETPSRVAVDTAFRNARANSDRENARIEHDRALVRVMTAVMRDDTELFKQFMDNEGFQYWDFKRKHHTSKGDLVHDVLCLANAEYTRPRFLIFGVDNSDFSLHDIKGSDGRRTQADIVDLFRDNAGKFFQSRFPSFHLREIAVDGTLVDVLVIEDIAKKPYYLVESIEKVQAHHIYTRVCDTG